jgi:hypothetical protein
VGRALSLVAYLLALAAVSAAAVGTAYSLWSSSLRVHGVVETGSWRDNVKIFYCEFKSTQNVPPPILIPYDDTLCFCIKTCSEDEQEVIIALGLYNPGDEPVLLLSPSVELKDNTVSYVEVLAAQDPDQCYDPQLELPPLGGTVVEAHGVVYACLRMGVVEQAAGQVEFLAVRAQG